MSSDKRPTKTSRAVDEDDVTASDIHASAVAAAFSRGRVPVGADAVSRGRSETAASDSTAPRVVNFGRRSGSGKPLRSAERFGASAAPFHTDIPESSSSFTSREDYRRGSGISEPKTVPGLSFTSYTAMQAAQHPSGRSMRPF